MARQFEHLCRQPQVTFLMVISCYQRPCRAPLYTWCVDNILHSIIIILFDKLNQYHYVKILMPMLNDLRCCSWTHQTRPWHPCQNSIGKCPAWPAAQLSESEQRHPQHKQHSFWLQKHNDLRALWLWHWGQFRRKEEDHPASGDKLVMNRFVAKLSN